MIKWLTKYYTRFIKCKFPLIIINKFCLKKDYWKWFEGWHYIKIKRLISIALKRNLFKNIIRINFLKSKLNRQILSFNNN